MWVLSELMPSYKGNKEEMGTNACLAIHYNLKGKRTWSETEIMKGSPCQVQGQSKISNMFVRQDLQLDRQGWEWEAVQDRDFCLQGRCLPLMGFWENLAVLTTKTQSFNYTYCLANSKENSIHLQWRIKPITLLL